MIIKAVTKTDEINILQRVGDGGSPMFLVSGPITSELRVLMQIKQVSFVIAALTQKSGGFAAN